MTDFKNTFKQFPKNTIHIIGVDAEKNEENSIIIYCSSFNEYFLWTKERKS